MRSSEQYFSMRAMLSVLSALDSVYGTLRPVRDQTVKIPEARTLEEGKYLA
jgi:hypothetical protein